MLKHFAVSLCLFLLASPLVVTAQDKAVQPKRTLPSLVLRLRSLESLFETSRLEALKPLLKDMPNFEEIIKEKVGPNGLEGIDYRRPIAIYTQIETDLEKLLKSVVLMVPISDEQKFVATLEKLDIKAAKDGTGLYTLQQNMFPGDVLMRCGHKYAYFTAGEAERIDKKRLADPKDVFPRALSGLVSATLSFENIPADVKATLVAKLGELTGQMVKQNEKESKAEREFREGMTEELLRYLRTALHDGKEVSFEIDIDKQTQNLRVDLVFSARADTELARTIRKFGEARSLFGGLLHKDAALNALVHFNLPEKITAKFAAFAREMSQKALEDTKNNDKEKDKDKKIQLHKLFEALMPTVEAGELDAAVSLRGPNQGRYTLVAGIKLQRTDQFMKALFAILKDLPPGEKNLLKLNAAKVGDVAIHRFDVQTHFDAKIKEVFGDNPLYFAFKKEAVYLALGEDGLQTIKEAIQAPTKEGPPLLVEASLGRLAKLFAKNDEDRHTAEKLLRQVSSDRVRVTVEGGEVLRLRLEMNLQAVAAIAQLGAQKFLEKEQGKEKEKQ